MVMDRELVQFQQHHLVKRQMERFFHLLAPFITSELLFIRALTARLTVVINTHAFVFMTEACSAIRDATAA